MRWGYLGKQPVRQKGNIYIAGLTVLSVILNIVISPWIPADTNVFNLFTETISQQFSACLFTFLVLACILANIRILRGETPVSTVLSDYLVHRLLVLLATFLCMFNFSIFKQTIPLVVPFSWDPVLLQIDQALFNGQLLSTWLDTYLPSMLLKYSADYCYASWVSLSGAIFLWRALSDNHAQRFQYLIAWLLCWIVLGSLMALIFSSAGPYFYAHFYTDVPKIVYQAYPSSPQGVLLTDSAKAFLLTGNQQHHYMVGLGISAFPSLHVAISVINAQTLAVLHPRLGQLGWLYVGAISISATYLGFHYAIDCLAGMIMAYGLWLLAGHLLQETT